MKIGRSSPRRIAGAALTALVLCSGCGDSSLDSALTQRHFFEWDRLGDRVTVTGVVSRINGPRTVEVGESADAARTLLVITRDPVGLEVGTAVRVTGTAGQIFSAMSADGAPYEQARMYDERRTRPYLFDAELAVVAAQRA